MALRRIRLITAVSKATPSRPLLALSYLFTRLYPRTHTDTHTNTCKFFPLRNKIIHDRIRSAIHLNEFQHKYILSTTKTEIPCIKERLTRYSCKRKSRKTRAKKKKTFFKIFQGIETNPSHQPKPPLQT